jgi:hypothetical protein
MSSSIAGALIGPDVYLVSDLGLCVAIEQFHPVLVKRNYLSLCMNSFLRNVSY